MMKRISAILAVISVAAMLFAAMPTTALAAGKGDYNGDGRLNTLDARAMLKDLLSGEAVTNQQIWWGDYDIDDAITTGDVRTMLTDLLDTAGSSAINYAKPTGEDYWGENSIAILGDSISFGAKADDPLPENTYAGYLKKAVSAANGGKLNYGFTSAYPTSWSSNRADEIHMWPDRSKTADGGNAWLCDQDDMPEGFKAENGNRLTSVGMTSWTKWSTITYTLRKPYVDQYNYFCVYYHMQPNGDGFVIADGNQGEVADINGSKSYIPTASDTEITMRTAFYRLSDCPKNADGQPQIIICHDGNEGKPVTITGIGYYKELPKANNADGYVTFNSFTRGGMRFCYLSDTVLRQAASADTLIFSLGYNDAHYGNMPDESFSKEYFAQRIDFMIDLCNANGTQVVVNNTTWPDVQTEPGKSNIAFVHSELRRLARETKGIYVEQIKVHGDALWEQIWAPNGDNVHPGSNGQKMMAQALVEALGLTWTEDWT
ncbi:MAG: hypothetical protein E7553_00630 [Ruminococcaceae bacterium]|nr:hypothetical protein [Oscillospiraceae bacterium]